MDSYSSLPQNRGVPHKKQDCKEAFGERLRELRLRIGLSQEELGDAAGLDRTYVSSCERGRRNVSIETICKFAAALRVSPHELLREVGQ